MAFYRPPGGTAGPPPSPTMKPGMGVRPRPLDQLAALEAPEAGQGAAGPPDIQAVLQQQRAALGRKPPMMGDMAEKPGQPPWADLPPPPPGADARALSDDPFGAQSLQFNDLLPAQLQAAQARGAGGGPGGGQRAGVGVNARGPAATAMQTQYGDTGPTAGGGVATPTGAGGGVGAANPFMQDGGMPQSPLTLDALPGAAGGGPPPSGPIMDPSQAPQINTAMQGFRGRAGNMQQMGAGRFGGAPPASVLARRRALAQRMGQLTGKL